MARSHSARSARPAVGVLLTARPPSKPAALQILRDHGFRDGARVFAAIQRLAADPLQRAMLRKLFPHLVRGCVASADADRAFINFERLVEALPNPSMFYHYLQEAPDRLGLLVRVFAHSQALTDTLLRNAAYFHFLIAPETLEHPREKRWLDAELRRHLLATRVAAEKYDVVRRFRRRETLRIGARDLVGRATVEETTLELSNLADVCLQAVFEIALDVVRAQFKLPKPSCDVTRQFAVIGMGKLGGQELNYSSDVDVIFVYREDGELTPVLMRHEFFTRLAEEIIRAVGSRGEEGNIFRIDLRLRPEGSSGPLVASLASCENYYAERGETWERMALIKARCVAGDEQLGAEFIAMVQPFVYSKFAGDNVVQQMAAIKQRIENEIVHDARLTRHVKLGIGGIREIEFTVQSFQVLRGAWQPALRNRSTLQTLPQLVKARLLGAPEAAALADAYRFLRNVEHRLQMEMELQTHTIPDEQQALERLARSLGFATVENFFAGQQSHTTMVRKIYGGVLASAVERATGVSFTQLTPEKVAAQLGEVGVVDGAAAVKLIDGLLHGTGFAHVSERTKQLFAQLWPALLKWTKAAANPDAALARFDRFVNAYGARGLLYELLVQNPRLVEMLLRVGDASRFFSEALAQRPELFDDICRGGALAEPKSRERMLTELQAAAAAGGPLDAAREWRRAELLRIGIEDVLELVDLEQVHHELTRLAEVCLEFGVAQARAALQLRSVPFAVIGLGKFGAQELGYGADLDVLFVGGEGTGYQEHAIKLATGVIDFMTRQTGAGSLYTIDARLRPDGEKGALASSLAAHQQYYLQRAQLWERQALIKARFVAGDAKLGQPFVRMVRDVVYAQPLTAAELAEIRHMRHRMETERGDQRHGEWEFKTGPGGLVDVEFLIQALQLRHGHAHPQLRTAHTLAALNRLTALGLVDDEASYQLRRGYLWLRKVESVLRRDEGTSVSHLPADVVAQARLAKRLGFASTDEFLKAYRLTLRRIRGIYQRHLGSAA